ncbi:ARHGQ factor, partial [Balaeniceps rex]|nr:ARHGQ factor [Balaeniceps rex]
TNPAFKEVLSRIESHEDCRNLPMISFLILPMQRVTRLPLLMDVRKELFFYFSLVHVLLMLAFFSYPIPSSFQSLPTFLLIPGLKCYFLALQPFPLVSSSRWLVKRGELTAYVEDTGLFSKRTSKQQVYFFLFNDVLIITKKK